MFADPEKNITQFMLGEGMKVADFGVGSGAYTLAAARAVGEHGLVYALDLQKDLLTKVAKTAQATGYNNVHTVWSDLEELGGTTLKDGSLDAVVFSNILFQVEKKETALREAFRVLREGGKMLLIDWSDSWGGMGPHPGAVVTRHTARTLAESVGFTFEQDITAGTHHYGMVFRKRPKQS